MALSDQKYLLFTTFQPSGHPVANPVWAVAVDDAKNKIGFCTSSGSGRAKRLEHVSRVIVQPCDSRGRPLGGTEPVEATAELVTGEQLDVLRTKVKEKYGVLRQVDRLRGLVGGIIKRNLIPYDDRGVIITLR